MPIQTNLISKYQATLEINDIYDIDEINWSNIIKNQDSEFDSSLKAAEAFVEQNFCSLGHPNSIDVTLRNTETDTIFEIKVFVETKTFFNAVLKFS
jgi:hypothetical protein